ncbi:hypothetical protein [Cetobacterium sp.]
MSIFFIILGFITIFLLGFYFGNRRNIDECERCEHRNKCTNCIYE